MDTLYIHTTCSYYNQYIPSAYARICASEALLTSLLLCNYKMASRYVVSGRLEELKLPEMVPTEALNNLDPLFEGTLRVGRSVSTAGIVPGTASGLLCAALGAVVDEQVSGFDSVAQTSTD